MHTQKSRASTEDNKVKLKRLTIDLTPQEHRTLKGLAAKAGLTMREMVLETLRQKGLLGRSKRGGRRSSAGPTEADPNVEVTDS